VGNEKAIAYLLRITFILSPSNNGLVRQAFNLEIVGSIPRGDTREIVKASSSMTGVAISLICPSDEIGKHTSLKSWVLGVQISPWV
jgi:hypothetical protein